MNLFNNYRRLADLMEKGTVFCAFDTETTGLKCLDDYVIEIGAVKFNKDGFISEFNTLIKPPVAINPFITQLTGITDQLVSDAPDSMTAFQDFLKFSDGTVLIAHNAPFDVGFVNSELSRINFPPLKNKIIDTLPLSRWAYPKLIEENEKGQYKLQSLAKRFSIDVYNAHRASDDARVCMELFRRIIKDTMSVQKIDAAEENLFS